MPDHPEKSKAAGRAGAWHPRQQKAAGRARTVPAQRANAAGRARTVRAAPRPRPFQRSPELRLARELRAALLTTLRMEPAIFRVEAADLDYLATLNRSRILGIRLASALAEERIHISRRTAWERVRLHRILTTVPAVDRAFMRGEIGVCQVLTIAPALRDGEPEPWIDLAKKLTVAELKREVRKAKPTAEIDPEYRVMHIPIPLRAKLAFEETIDLARKVIGSDVPVDECMESILLETGWAGAAEVEPREPRTIVRRQPRAIRRSSWPLGIRLEELARARRAIDELVDFVEGFAIEFRTEPRHPADAYDRLRGLRTTRARLRAIQSRLLRALRQTRCYRHLGYRRIEDFIEGDLRLSERLGRELVSESFLFEECPAIERAFTDGRIGVSKAYALRRLARESDMAAWIDRASIVLIRPFARECRLVELLRQCDRELAARFTGPFPHPDLEDALEQKLITTYRWTTRRLRHEMRVRGLSWDRSGSTDAGRNFELMARLEVLMELLVAERYTEDLPLTEPPDPFLHRKRQMFALARREFTSPEEWTMLRLVLKDETYADVEAMIRGFRERYGPEMARYIPILLAARHFHGTWTVEDPEASVPTQESIMRRDNYHCLYPCCISRRHLHGHHLRFRSRGGSDHKWNRGSFCEADHIDIIHAGHARVTGKAPHALRIEVGHRPDGRPIIVLEGGVIVEET